MEFEKWCVIRANVGAVLAWVMWVAGLPGRRANVGGWGCVLAWVTC